MRILRECHKIYIFLEFVCEEGIDWSRKAWPIRVFHDRSFLQEVTEEHADNYDDIYMYQYLTADDFLHCALECGDSDCTITDFDEETNQCQNYERVS